MQMIHWWQTQKKLKVCINGKLGEDSVSLSEKYANFVLGMSKWKMSKCDSLGGRDDGKCDKEMRGRIVIAKTCLLETKY